MLHLRLSIPKAASSVRCFRTSEKLWYVPEGYDYDSKNSVALERIRRQINEDKANLQWRTPVGDRPGDWNSKLRVFANDDQTSDHIVMMQQPIDLSPKSIKNWWQKRKIREERFMQQFVPERHEILGPDLAAAHFLIYRGGAAKFVGRGPWVRANEDGEFNLPNKYDASYKVEALRCDNMKLYYEGLENIRGLQYLKFLSFHNVKTFDDFCLDRVSGSQFTTLEVLDISGTNCTADGLCCLYRLPTLKLLIVDDPKTSLKYELCCAMLEETIPRLKIVPATAVHNNTSEEGIIIAKDK